MVRELIAPAPNQVAWHEIPSRPLAPHQIRVRSYYGAAKHGTEMSLFKGTASLRGGYDNRLRLHRAEVPGVNYPVRLGNIIVGKVTEVGSDVTRHAVGDMVFNYGSFAEEHVWPQTVRRLPPDVPWQAAVCLDPVDFAIGALRDGNVRIGDAVAVFGMGGIGLLAIQLAKLAGAYPVIAVDPLESRRELAKTCGADLIIDPTSTDTGLVIKEATENRGADVCIEYSGSHHALQAALRGVAYLGTVVAGAWPGPYPAGLDLGAEAHMNRPKIIFSRAVSEPNPDYPNWDENRIFEVAWRYLASGALQTIPIIQPVVDFNDLLSVYPQIATHPQEYIKLGVRFPHNSESEASRTS
ncbi:MAG: zinc-binding alcohol dehydrogenase [Caldilineaceae bacterium]|nr:zinc-binding alcohol dehydrogenase [Caldilineaceae bacterium]